MPVDTPTGEIPGLIDERDQSPGPLHIVPVGVAEKGGQHLFLDAHAVPKTHERNPRQDQHRPSAAGRHTHPIKASQSPVYVGWRTQR